MKLTLKSLGVILLSGIGPFAAHAEPLAGKITALTGKAQVFENGRWMLAHVGTEVYPSTSIQTGYNSKVILTFRHGGQIALKHNTTISFAELSSAADGSKVEVHLTNGGVNSFIPRADDGKLNQFRVRTPTAVAGVRGSFISATRHGQHFAVKALHSPATMEPGGAPSETDVARAALLRAAAEKDSLTLTSDEAKACLSAGDQKLAEGARLRINEVSQASSQVDARLNTLRMIVNPAGAADTRADVQSMRTEIREMKDDAAAARPKVQGFDREVKIAEGNGAATESGRLVSPFQLQITEVRPYQPYMPGQTRNEALFMFNNVDNKAGLGNDFQRLFNTINRQRQPTNLVIPKIRTF